MNSTNTDRNRLFNSLKYDAEAVRIWRNASMERPDSAAARQRYERALSDFGCEVMRCRMMNAHIVAMRRWVKS